MRVVVSNGSNQFHLAPLSAELDRRGLLAGFITSGWPSGLLATVANRYRAHPSVARFLSRKEAITASRVYSTNAAEAVFQVGIRLRRISEHTEQRFDRLAFWWYSRYAGRVVARLRPNIYHYRACYGLGSISRAATAGAVSICDHSIAHPAVLQYMIDNEGRWPSHANRIVMGPLQKLMATDLAAANVVIVNSDFVRKTCIFAGVESSRIQVVYLGVDDKFFANIPSDSEEMEQGRRSAPLLFAGGFQRRKGALTLVKAWGEMADVPLTIVGGVDRDLDQLNEVRRFFANPKVKRVGILPRSELAGYMKKSRVFVFPSYCEGSARVIFEAMASGCFIITTENSGSIVEDRVHGRIVPAGNPSALVGAVRWAHANMDHVTEVGRQNAELVRNRYRQRQYGDNVISVYKHVLSEHLK